MKKVVFVVLATLWLFACKKEDGKKVEFRALPFSSIVSDTLEIDSVRMNTFFSNPTSLFTIDDSLILVFDDNRSDKLCHFIHTKGYVVKSFGEWGRARGEFILPQGLSLSKDKEACCVYDYYCLLFRKRGIGWRQSCSRCDKNGRSGKRTPRGASLLSSLGFIRQPFPWIWQPS